MNSYSDVLSEQTETDYNILSELFSQVQRDLHTAKVYFNFYFSLFHYFILFSRKKTIINNN